MSNVRNVIALSSSINIMLILAFFFPNPDHTIRCCRRCQRDPMSFCHDVVSPLAALDRSPLWTSHYDEKLEIFLADLLKDSGIWKVVR